MPRLAELQVAFKQALLQDDDAVASVICGDGLTPQARLVIYRHHVLTTLTDVLKTTYPVVCRLVFVLARLAEASRVNPRTQAQQASLPPCERNRKIRRKPAARTHSQRWLTTST